MQNNVFPESVGESAHAANLRFSESLLRKYVGKGGKHKELTLEAEKKWKNPNKDATSAVLISQITEDASLP